MISIVKDQKFGRLTVIAPAGSARGYRLYLCRCDCGKQKTVAGSHMVNGLVRSCGCARRQYQNNRQKRLAVLKARFRAFSMADIFPGTKDIL